MILYKYVSLEAAKKIAQTGRISFTRSDQFNDPFEMHAISNFAGTRNECDPTKLDTNYSMMKACLQGYGVLSLTRDPLNSLMWSHYGDEHRGVVLGIDVEQAGFCCKQTNLIPADLGEIIYTKTFPHRLSIDKNIQSFDCLRSLSEFSWDAYEFYKFAYLFKSLEWAYEEEVRVIKRVGFPLYNKIEEEKNYYCNTNGDWHHLALNNNKDLNLNKFPIESVKELFIGMSAMGSTSAKEVDEIVDLYSDSTVAKGCALGLRSYQISTIKWK